MSEIISLNCPNCNAPLSEGARHCDYCGTDFKIVEKEPAAQTQPQIIVNVNVPSSNTVNTTDNGNTPIMKRKNKWVAFFLCLYLGFFGVHKFYEGNSKAGKLYLFTLGLFGLGWFIDLFILLSKPNHYYVK